MPKKKRKKSPKTVPLRVRLLVAFLMVTTIAGIGLVKLLETTRGKVILLDIGFTSYYDIVQEELDGDLRRSLIQFGLLNGLTEEVRITRVRGDAYYVRHWKTRCDGPCSSAKINLAVTKSAKRRGAVASSSLENWGKRAVAGATIVITVGSRRYPTHRITIDKPRHTPQALPAPPTVPKLALVIDDFGYSKADVVEAFFEMDLPLTISVIPSLPRTRYAIERAKSSGKQAILHLPMEAEDHQAQEGVILTTMDDDRIRGMVDRYLKETSGVVGVNNHQGSLATRDPRVMETVIRVIKQQGLFFLDSLTSAESIAYNTARNLGVPTAKNDLFLDDDTEDPLVVEDRLLRLVALAKQRGWAVGIGHPKSWTYEAISRNEQVLKESGVDLVFVSEIME
ncbi:MAG: divergent polysaccharide deacetylase family protein [Candidatus Krumholzibacteria bacterium]|nr:divergent polysaccharide deacetylase family protein [Candidatus Krumholzibacteria bacterium]